MKKVLLGSLLTLVVIMGFGYTFLGENIKVERKEQSHNRTIIIDGKVSSSQNWIEVLGYEISIDLNDGTYIGK